MEGTYRTYDLAFTILVSWFYHCNLKFHSELPMVEMGLGETLLLESSSLISNLKVVENPYSLIVIEFFFPIRPLQKGSVSTDPPVG
jgi:hypothetical protein